MTNKTIPFKDRCQPIKEVVNCAMQDIFIKRGFLNTKIITDWNDVVGEELYKKYKPSKIIHNGKKIVLYLDAITLRDRQHITYNKTLIIEKINVFLGHKAIDDIKITD